MMNSLLWLVIFIGRMVGAALTGKVSRSRILLTDGVGLFAFFLVMFFSRAAGLIILGLIGVGFFMATIYPTAFGSDCIKGNDLGCSIMIFTGSAGGIITPALVGFVAESAGIRAGMGLIVVYTALLLLSIILSALSVRTKRGQSHGPIELRNPVKAGVRRVSPPGGPGAGTAIRRRRLPAGLRRAFYRRDE